MPLKISGWVFSIGRKVTIIYYNRLFTLNVRAERIVNVINTRCSANEIVLKKNSTTLYFDDLEYSVRTLTGNPDFRSLCTFLAVCRILHAINQCNILGKYAHVFIGYNWKLFGVSMKKSIRNSHHCCVIDQHNMFQVESFS